MVAVHFRRHTSVALKAPKTDVTDLLFEAVSGEFVAVEVRGRGLLHGRDIDEDVVEAEVRVGVRDITHFN